MKYQKLGWSLMENNITEDDRNALINFLKTDPKLTNGPKVLEFEEAWSKWLGVKYSVFVNSGASANLLTMAYLALDASKTEGKEVIVPTLTWSSDISSVLQNGFVPHFYDIQSKTLGANPLDFPSMRHAAFITHILGLPSYLPNVGIVIEDCCESHGATIHGRKIGTFGHISNFSFYFAHHMTTIEGGMICTDHEHIYEPIRMLRSHGMVREMRSKKMKESWAEAWPDVHPSFMFAFPAYNCRNTELGAVLGLNQLKRLDEGIERRRKNLNIFLGELSSKLYRTDLATEGSSPYGLILILKEPDLKLRDKVEKLFDLCEIEYRRGLSGGGNQLRQPYLRHLGLNPKDYPEVEHITDFGWYIGNFPELEHKKIRTLCKLLNQF